MASRLTQLLRRTRVSTFDPAVRQVYQAPVAHSVRGDWGFKRPLPSSWQASADAPAPQPHEGALRYATVAQIDTQQGLTDWSESERDPLFRARWQETGARLADRARRDVLGVSVAGDDDAYAAQGPRPRIAYDAATRDGSLPAHVVWGTHHARFADKPDALPNYNAMDERTFQRFLSQVRRQRGKFRKALAAQRAEAAELARLERLARQQPADEAPAPGIDLWTEARLPHAPQSAAAFLEEQAQSRLAAPASRAITAPAHAAPAHPLRGLQYAQPDSVYTYLLSAPVQGRAVMRVEDSRRSRYFMGSDAALAVASGGHVGHLPLQHRHGLDVVDYTRAKPARGAGHFRVLHAWLDRHAVPTPPRRTPPGVHASEPELGYVRTQMMALRRPVHDAPLPGSPRWIDEPEDARVLRASSPEAGSLFGAIARSGRAAPQPRSHAKRQRLQKRKRDAPSSTNKDVQMLDNIKNLLAPQ